MKSNNDDSSEVCNNVIKVVTSEYFKFKGDTRQLHTQMHPIVSNAMYKRENELLEQERFKVLITLARTLDDENVNKAIVALKYQLTVKK
jgi:hypothetical protein